MTTKEKKKIVGKEATDYPDQKKLILYNDDFNTFDYVIDTLIEVLGHDQNQAETCVWIAHFKGKCAVKKGDFTTLKQYYNELTFRRLTVEIQ
ncbi:MAG: ATP-dependent Clp protease adaptor ClpS [Bacteroidales bacterium]|nr:ATP-dependent Clp protease adaptor ClpS [Bacteroidales bacterium]